MSDPWSLTVAILALLGQAPDFVGKWQSFIKKLRDRGHLPEKDLAESEVTLLEAREDWLTHKVILLDLVVAFSAEHTVNERVLKFCKAQRPRVHEEFREVGERLAELNEKSTP